MSVHEAIAAFLQTQLDFTYFFYGLAFILLGAVATGLACQPGLRAIWIWLGLFGFVHGACEWLDLLAFIGGDHPLFALGRLILTACSFLLLLEFARRRSDALGTPMGLALPAALCVIVLVSAMIGGVATAAAVVRYALAFPAAIAVAGKFLLRAQTLPPSDRRLARAAAVLFALYGIAAGLIVPQAPLWPAEVVNQASFLSVTGVPIQLVRGILAGLLAYVVWSMWLRTAIVDSGSEPYAARLRRHGLSALGILCTILLGGWTLTEAFGLVNRRNVEATAQADLSLLAHRVAGQAAVTSGVARLLAEVPPLLAAIDGNDQDAAEAALQLGIAAINGRYAAVLDRSGAVVAKSGAMPEDVDLHRLPPVRAALAGEPETPFPWVECGDDDKFVAATPLRRSDGSIAGAVLIAKLVSALNADVTGYPRTFFLLSPEGVILHSNLAGAVLRPLWPLDDAALTAAQARRGRIAGPPLLARSVGTSVWLTTIAGEQHFVRRAFLNDSEWSLVLMVPEGPMHVSRALGIAATYLLTTIALIYLFGREHAIRDQEQRSQRRELQDLAQMLRFRASTDALTGLFNRAKFNETLEHELARAARSGAPLALLMFDVDHFKQVNDIHGHQAGDQVLVRISDVVASSIGDGELLARWGGEEFVALFPGQDAQAVYRIAEEVRRKIEAIGFADIGPVTCSFGIADYTQGDTPERLLERADAALYRAKANGRNRTEHGVAQPSRSVA